MVWSAQGYQALHPFPATMVKDVVFGNQAAHRMPDYMESLQIEIFADGFHLLGDEFGLFVYRPGIVSP